MSHYSTTDLYFKLSENSRRLAHIGTLGDPRDLSDQATKCALLLHRERAEILKEICLRAI